MLGKLARVAETSMSCEDAIGFGEKRNIIGSLQIIHALPHNPAACA
jgi:hypothetical protein